MSPNKDADAPRPTRQKRKALKLLAKVRPFDEWVAAVNPTEAQKEMYWKVVNELEKLAEES